MDVTEFLLARIGEDEAVAREAAEWYSSVRVNRWDESDRAGMVPDPIFYSGWEPGEAAAAVETDLAKGRAKNARVLADCEAKRRIVAEQVRERHVIDQGHVTDWTMGGWGARHTCLRALASIYRAHPDFDPAWEV